LISWPILKADQSRLNFISTRMSACGSSNIDGQLKSFAIELSIA